MAEFDSADDLINFIDFNKLRKQKLAMLEIMDAVKGGVDQKKIDDAQGIINLIDHIQDLAVDVLGKDEKEVFNLAEEKNSELIQMWLDAEEENRKHTKEGDDKCLELKVKFSKEFDQLSDEDKKYVKGYLDDLGA